MDYKESITEDNYLNYLPCYKIYIGIFNGRKILHGKIKYVPVSFLEKKCLVAVIKTIKCLVIQQNPIPSHDNTGFEMIRPVHF